MFFVSTDDVVRSLAARLRLTRPLVFLDIETTGLSAESDRIVEIALTKIHPDGRMTRMEHLVHPEGSIPSQASAIHGITDRDVRGAPTFRELAPSIAAALEGADLAGFNVARFDLKLLAVEFARAGIEFRMDGVRVIDAMAIYHRNERRDLHSAVRFYRDREHKGHRAAEDVDATIEVLAAQLDRYPTLPSDLVELADYCENRQPDWLTRDGKIAWRDGAARITFGKHAGKSLQTMAKEEPGYLRWVLDKDFPADFKRLVAEAVDGRFPNAASISP